jgi:hypothetical protein
MSAAEYHFLPDERPLFPGSPFAPHHTPKRRMAYAATGLLIGSASTFTNALTNVNVANLAGPLDLTLMQASILPAIYVAMNATANLSLMRARQQFGIPQVTLTLLAVYALAALVQLVLPGYAQAIAVRATCGLAAAGLVTLGIYYLMQLFPPKLRPLGLVLGISLPQLGTPLARLVPVDILAVAGGRGLSLIELGVALAAAAAILAVPLPKSECSKAFEPLDFVTIGLTVPAFLLICIVLGEGRLLWWSNAPWLGWSLAGAVPLLAAALMIELRRARPLLQLRWLGSTDILRFAAVAVLVRLALAEQAYGAVGFLTSGGLTNDQLHGLFAIVALAMVLGAVTAALTLSERRVPYQVMAAAMIIALGAWLDSGATSITRPPQLYGSQALIAFGTALFVGPTLVYGFLRMLSKGPAHLVSLIVLFSVTQNVGGLAGSAILGSYQVIAARAHAGSLTEHLIAADPLVAARLQNGVVVLSNVLGDPVLRGAEGAGLLGQAVATQANTLAFNDVFRLVAMLALATALYIATLIIFYAARRRRQAILVAA